MLTEFTRFEGILKTENDAKLIPELQLQYARLRKIRSLFNLSSL